MPDQNLLTADQSAGVLAALYELSTQENLNKLNDSQLGDVLKQIGLPQNAFKSREELFSTIVEPYKNEFSQFKIEFEAKQKEVNEFLNANSSSDNKTAGLEKIAELNDVMMKHVTQLQTIAADRHDILMKPLFDKLAGQMSDAGKEWNQQIEQSKKDDKEVANSKAGLDPNLPIDSAAWNSERGQFRLVQGDKTFLYRPITTHDGQEVGDAHFNDAGVAHNTVLMQLKVAGSDKTIPVMVDQEYHSGSIKSKTITINTCSDTHQNINILQGNPDSPTTNPDLKNLKLSEFAGPSQSANPAQQVAAAPAGTTPTNPPPANNREADIKSAMAEIQRSTKDLTDKNVNGNNDPAAIKNFLAAASKLKGQEIKLADGVQLTDKHFLDSGFANNVAKLQAKIGSENTITKEEIDKTIAMAEDMAANKDGVIKTHGDTHVAKADSVDPKLLAFDSSKVQVQARS